MTRLAVGRFYDNFARPDGAVLGGPLTGPDWVAGAFPTLVGGTLTADTNGNGYAYLDVGAPPSRAAGKVSWDNDSGATNGGVVINCSPVNSAISGLTPGIHVGLWPDRWGLLLALPTWPTATSFGGGLALNRDGTIYSWGLRYRGQTLTIELPDGSEQFFTDPRIVSLWGQFMYYQAAFTIGTDDRPRWHSATIDRPVARALSTRTVAGTRPVAGNRVAA